MGYRSRWTPELIGMMETYRQSSTYGQGSSYGYEPRTSSSYAARFHILYEKKNSWASATKGFSAELCSLGAHCRGWVHYNFLHEAESKIKEFVNWSKLDGYPEGYMGNIYLIAPTVEFLAKVNEHWRSSSEFFSIFDGDSFLMALEMDRELRLMADAGFIACERISKTDAFTGELTESVLWRDPENRANLSRDLKPTELGLSVAHEIRLRLEEERRCLKEIELFQSMSESIGEIQSEIDELNGAYEELQASKDPKDRLGFWNPRKALDFIESIAPLYEEGAMDKWTSNDLSRFWQVSVTLATRRANILVGLKLAQEIGNARSRAFKLSQRALEAIGGFKKFFESTVAKLSFEDLSGLLEPETLDFPDLEGFEGPLEPRGGKVNGAAWTTSIAKFGTRESQGRALGLSRGGAAKYLTMDTVLDALRRPGVPVRMGTGQTIAGTYLDSLVSSAAGIDKHRLRVYWKPEPQRPSRGVPYLFAIPLSIVSAESEENAESSLDLTTRAPLSSGISIRSSFRGALDKFSPAMDGALLYCSMGEKKSIEGPAAYVGFTSRDLRSRIGEHLRDNDYDFVFDGTLVWELPPHWRVGRGSGEVSLAEGLLLHTIARTLGNHGGWVQNKSYHAKVRDLSEAQVDEVLEILQDQVYPAVSKRLRLEIIEEPRPVLSRKGAYRGIHLYDSGSYATGEANRRVGALGWPTAQPR